MKIQGIYKIVNRLNNKIYIGQSIDVNQRFIDHKCNSIKNFKHPLYNSMCKHGIDNFEFIILEEVISVHDLDKKEQYWMDFYKSYDRNFGYNLRSKAESNRGYKHSEETRNKIASARKGGILSEETKRKIGLANKGKPSNRKGCVLSEESIRKRTESRKGYKHSEEAKKKMSLSKIGKKQSKEHKRKNSESHKGKVVSAETREKISKNNKGKKRKPLSAEWKQKISEKLRGKEKRSLTEEHKHNLKRAWQKRKLNKDIMQIIPQTNIISFKQAI